MKLRPLLRTFRDGDVRGRVRALRTAQQALSVAVTASALRTGLLDQLGDPALGTDVAASRGWDPSLTEALLHSYAAFGLLTESAAGWTTSTKGRRVLSDDIVRAAYEAFGTYHTGLYRDIEEQLVVGGERRDIELDGELIARLSRFMDRFVLAELDRVVDERPPRRLLDVGCGTGAHLTHVLSRAPGSAAVGVETDAKAAALARGSVEQHALGERARIVEADVRDVLGEQPAESFDLILLANVVYYVPVDERVALLRALAECLEHGGRLLVVTTALTDDSFSRHFDLLLRAQRGAAELPDMTLLAEQLREAGLEPSTPRRIAPGEPLTALVAHRR